jgi:hypothetical protein
LRLEWYDSPNDFYPFVPVQRKQVRKKFATDAEVKLSATFCLLTFGTLGRNTWCHGGLLFNVDSEQMDF